jgi:hypothetical protein
MNRSMWPSPASGYLDASTEERNWAMAAHIGIKHPAKRRIVHTTDHP